MERTIVRLKIISSTMSPEAISEYVGIKCDKSCKVGDFRSKTLIREKENKWLFHSGLPETDSLDSHVVKLLELLQPFKNRIRALSAANTVDFSCVLYAESSPAINFTSESIEKIAGLGASLDVDYYGFEPD